MSSIILRFLAEPSTVNFGDKVHGGTVMKWIDEAGYACATSWSKRYCVCLLYTSPSPRDGLLSRMPSSA